jgi:hypothetical protein
MINLLKRLLKIEGEIKGLTEKTGIPERIDLLEKEDLLEKKGLPEKIDHSVRREIDLSDRHQLSVRMGSQLLK